MTGLTDGARRFLAATAPDHTAVQSEMAAVGNDPLGNDPLTDGTATRGIAAYLDTVRADDAVEIAVLPVGEGIAVSTVVE